MIISLTKVRTYAKNKKNSGFYRLTVNLWR